MWGAKKSAVLVAGLFGVAAGACFPDLSPDRGSLTVGLLGVDASADTVRLTVTAGTERVVVEESLTPAAAVRIEIVPVGPVGILAETLAAGTSLQTKGLNTEVVAGENEVGVDFGSTGPDPPAEVRSAPQRVDIELRTENISAGRVGEDDRIERDPFLSFLSAARASLGGPVQVVGVVEAVASTNDDTFDAVFDGPFTLEIAPEDGGGIVVGTFEASGTSANLAANGADLTALSAAFEGGRFDVRLDGPTTRTQLDVEIRVQIVFAATLR